MNQVLQTNQPTNPNLAKLTARLSQIEPGPDDQEWWEALLFVYFESEGSDDGLCLADAWTKTGKYYPGFDTIRSIWEGFRQDTIRTPGIDQLIRLLKKYRKG